MKRAFGGVLLFGMGLSVGLGACVGEGALVGTNLAGSGGSGHSAGSGGTATVPRSAPVRTTYYTDLIGHDLNLTPLCLPRLLGVDEAGRATAKVFAVQLEGPASCDCTGPGRAPVTESNRELSLGFMAQNAYCDGLSQYTCDDMCVCEVLQAEGASLNDCQYNVTPASDTTGWCYVSPEQGVGTDPNAAQCAMAAGSRLRFFGNATQRGETYWIGAHHTEELPEREAPAAAPFGAPCLPEDELSLDFLGYSEKEVSVVSGTPECDSGVCLVNHFRGRVSCPYGQTEEEVGSTPQCFQPGTDLTVTTPVFPQLLDRAAASTVVCSCRCNGPEPGDFCQCPSDMECRPLIGDLGLSGSDVLAGSYCIPRGTVYNPTDAFFDRCNTDLANCGDPRPY